MSGDAFEKGLAILKEMGWGENPLPRVKGSDEEFWRISVEQLFGGVWTRPGLSIRDRQLVTMAALMAMNAGNGLKPHFRIALAKNFTKDELREMVLHVMYYAGWPAGMDAVAALSEVIAETESGER